MDAIQNYAGDLDPGIGQCLLTQSASASPSRILQSHPQVWIHAAQPSGVRWTLGAPFNGQSIDAGQAAAPPDACSRQNYWRQDADVLTVSLPTTPSERTRKIRPEQPEHATRSQ
jgi:hypothetical protein